MQILDNSTSKNLRIFLLLAILPLFIWGCNPVYTLNDFNSKADYYKQVNAGMEGKQVSVHLSSSDSTFQGEDAVIQNDSICLTTMKEFGHKRVKRIEIKSAAYFNKSSDNLCAKIELNNGDSFVAEYIVVNADSTIDYQYLNSKSVRLPIKDLKNISYKNNRGVTAGLGYGLLGGAVTGLGLALVVNNQRDHPSGMWSDQGSYPPAGVWFAASLGAGSVIGTPIGWIIGGRTTWEFGK